MLFVKFLVACAKIDQMCVATTSSYCVLGLVRHCLLVIWFSFGYSNVCMWCVNPVDNFVQEKYFEKNAYGFEKSFIWFLDGAT